MAKVEEGGCLCGKVRFRVTKEPLLTMACHCRGCQQLTGSAFSISAMYPADALEVTAGEPVAGGLHGPHQQLFCPHCLSWVFTRPDGADWLVNVRATQFDESAEAPFVEMYTDEKLPWVSMPVKRSFPRFPEADDWRELMDAFKATGA